VSDPDVDTAGAIDSPESAAVRQQFEMIRQRLSERRRALGLSMSELARQVGVSPSMVSQIERGRTLPSVATLFALASALGATVDAFFTEPGDSDWEDHSARDRSAGDGTPRPVYGSSAVPALERRYVVRRNARAGIEIQGGVVWERLTPTSLDGVDFLELVYQPHAESNSELYRHPGIEMVLVLEGRFDIYVGFERFELGRDDSITFASSLPHRYVNPTDTVSRAVTTILRDTDFERLTRAAAPNVIADSSYLHAEPRRNE
jgi:transcriptional regulator with XRE-family HTH domain